MENPTVCSLYAPRLLKKFKKYVLCFSFYLAARKEASSHLTDGTGHRPHYSLRTLCRALKYAAANPCRNVQRSLYEVRNHGGMGFFLRWDSKGVLCKSNGIIRESDSGNVFAWVCVLGWNSDPNTDWSLNCQEMIYGCRLISDWPNSSLHHNQLSLENTEIILLLSILQLLRDDLVR